MAKQNRNLVQQARELGYFDGRTSRVSDDGFPNSREPAGQFGLHGVSIITTKDPAKIIRAYDAAFRAGHAHKMPVPITKIPTERRSQSVEDPWEESCNHFVG